MSENKDKSKESKRLADIVRNARMSSAEKQDVVVDMKEADKARLELLAEKLEPIVKDIDSADERFEFVISSGTQPRFWIDPVAQVHMGRDRRTFRFIRDSQFGRVVIAETADIDTIYDHITAYVADRIVEREKILEGDLETFKDYYARMTNERLGVVAETSPAVEKAELIDAKRQESSSAPLVIGATWFVLGSVLGLALAFNYREELAAFLQSV